MKQMTMVVERFGCKYTMPTGRTQISAVIPNVFGSLIFSRFLERKFARMRIRPIFTNSDGWI